MTGRRARSKDNSILSGAFLSEPSASLSFCDVDYDYNYDYDDFENNAIVDDLHSYEDDGHNPLFDRSGDAEFNQRFNQSTSMEESVSSEDEESEGLGRIQSRATSCYGRSERSQATEPRGWGSPLMGHLARDTVSCLILCSCYS